MSEEKHPRSSAGNVYDLLQRLRDYLDINRRPGNDLSPKFSAEITAALATFDEPQPARTCATCGGFGRIAHESGGYGINCPACTVPRPQEK